MSKHPYQAVLGRVRAYIKADGQGDDGVYELWRIKADTALQLGATPGLGLARDEQALSAQVRRALGTIVSEGTLIKIARDQYGPDGTRDGVSPRYYTPAAFKRAEAAVARSRESAAALAVRWEQVYRDLAEAGFRPVSLPGEPVVLSLDTWENVASAVWPDPAVRQV